MHRKGIWVLLIVLLAGLAPAAWAESHEEAAAAPSLFFIWTDHVTVAHAAAYEAETKKVLAKLAATDEGKKLSFSSLSGPAGYSYVLPLADMADFSKKSQEFMAATLAVGGMEVWDAANRLTDHGSGQFFVLRPGLSYTPAEPREAEKTGQIRAHDWWYVRTGHEPAIEKIASELAASYAENNIDTGWRVYQAVTGDDLPLYVVSSAATDPADHYANEARVGGLMGEAAQKLIQEALSHTRRVETTFARMRPDMSMGM